MYLCLSLCHSNALNQSQVTQTLLEQLAGREPPKRRILKPLKQQQQEQLRRIDPKLASALQTSRRVGDVLIKIEDEEMLKVQQLADVMLHSEYAAPARPPFCQQEAAACLQCYEQNQSDPLKCRDAVAAYSRCATESTSAMLQQQ